MKRWDKENRSFDVTHALKSTYARYPELNLRIKYLKWELGRSFDSQGKLKHPWTASNIRAMLSELGEE